MSVWTDERVERLKTLIKEGYSSAVIAEYLGAGISRNAVIGKVHRMGLMLHTRPDGERRMIGRKSRKKSHKAQCLKTFRPPPIVLKPEPIPVGPEPVVPEHERKGVVDLEAHDCRWPIGDPKDRDFHFCNGKRLPGLAYCAHHARRAYRPVELKRGLPQRTRVFEPADVEPSDVEV